MHASPEPTAAPRREAPGLRLGRRTLTCLLLGALTAPPLLIFYFWWTLTPPVEAQLNAEVRIDRREAATPSIIVENHDAVEWNHFDIELNSVFLHKHREPTPAGGAARLPLAAFINKNNGRSLNPDVTQVERVRIFAQLPHGARGVANRTLSP